MKFTARLSRWLVLGAGLLLTSSACIVDDQDLDVDIDTSAHESGFDWGGDCSTGSGQFQANVPQGQTSVVGTIPVRKRDVRIDLTSPTDVDVQLIEVATGHEIIAWPYGDLNGPSQACTSYKGVDYCYSGYNGDQTQSGRGNEWIEVHGDTNIELEMRAYGYAAGSAVVEYAWDAVPTCNEMGEGEFQQFVPDEAVVTIGELPEGKVNVRIELSSNNDVDIQLYDGNVALVQWPDGMLSGPTQSSMNYQDMHITYSGYNGDGTGWGHEYIEVQGALTRTLTMKAYGYAAGNADVEYWWGQGAGEGCGSQLLPPCGPGLQCKNGNDGHIEVDIPGTCHTQNWCESEQSASSDCANLAQPNGAGEWGCDVFECAWRPDNTQPATCSLANQTCPADTTCHIGCPTNENCGINPPGVCLRDCTDSFDCAAGDYCSTEGVCRTDGECTIDDDCNVDGNQWELSFCIATTTAQNVCDGENRCHTECVPLPVLE
jgi:hypothetical protein